MVLRFAELEVLLAEAGRARALYELAISQPVLDMPESLWKAYIDFEIAQVGGLHWVGHSCCSPLTHAAHFGFATGGPAGFVSRHVVCFIFVSCHLIGCHVMVVTCYMTTVACWRQRSSYAGAKLSSS